MRCFILFRPGSLFVLLALVNPIRADFLLKNYNHSQTLTNNTGKTANDLTVNLVHPATGSNPTAPPFAPGGTGGLTISFSGGTVANGGSSTVSWQSKFASDTLFPGDEGFWTFNGGNIGGATVATSGLIPTYRSAGGNVVIASLVNTTGTSIAYTGLQIVTGANISFFNDLNNYDSPSALATGTTIPLLVPTSGSLAPNSTTDIGQFASSTGFSVYDVGVLFVNNQIFAEGAANVPEPGTAGTVAVVLALGVVAAWRHSRPAISG